MSMERIIRVIQKICFVVRTSFEWVMLTLMSIVFWKQLNTSELDLASGMYLHASTCVSSTGTSTPRAAVTQCAHEGGESVLLRFRYIKPKP